MKNNLFEKVICFTDLHIGLRHNSKVHLDDCLEYIEWFIAEGKQRGAETCICLGDFMHHRNTVNALTLEYGIKILTLLNASFEHTYFLVGNHDLYLKDSRTITSMKFATLFPNITLIDSPKIIDNVALVPWLVEDEWEQIPDIDAKYLFGHLEIPGFKMNAMISMPDHGMLNATHLNQDRVFSGHFHMRQSKGNISYIGNPFGHNYSDVWDFDRGAMFLEWDKEPEFINYVSGPRFININLTALVENPEIYLKPKTHLQVILDASITYEEASSLREIFLSDFDVREFKLIRNPEEELAVDYNGDIAMKTVDQIVLEGLLILESNKIDPNMLIEIYDRL